MTLTVFNLSSSHHVLRKHNCFHSNCTYLLSSLNRKMKWPLRSNVSKRQFSYLSRSRLPGSVIPSENDLSRSGSCLSSNLFCPVFGQRFSDCSWKDSLQFAHKYSSQPLRQSPILGGCSKNAKYIYNPVIINNLSSAQSSANLEKSRLPSNPASLSSIHELNTAPGSHGVNKNKYVYDIKKKTRSQPPKNESDPVLNSTDSPKSRSNPIRDFFKNTKDYQFKKAFFKLTSRKPPVKKNLDYVNCENIISGIVSRQPKSISYVNTNVIQNRLPKKPEVSNLPKPRYRYRLKVPKSQASATLTGILNFNSTKNNFKNSSGGINAFKILNRTIKLDKKSLDNVTGDGRDSSVFTYSPEIKLVPNSLSVKSVLASEPNLKLVCKRPQMIEKEISGKTTVQKSKKDTLSNILGKDQNPADTLQSISTHPDSKCKEIVCHCPCDKMLNACSATAVNEQLRCLVEQNIASVGMDNVKSNFKVDKNFKSDTKNKHVSNSMHDIEINSTDKKLKFPRQDPGSIKSDASIPIQISLAPESRNYLVKGIAKDENYKSFPSDEPSVKQNRSILDIFRSVDKSAVIIQKDLYIKEKILNKIKKEDSTKQEEVKVNKVKASPSSIPEPCNVNKIGVAERTSNFQWRRKLKHSAACHFQKQLNHFKDSTAGTVQKAGCGNADDAIPKSVGSAGVSLNRNVQRVDTSSKSVVNTNMKFNLSNVGDFKVESCENPSCGPDLKAPFSRRRFEISDSKVDNLKIPYEDLSQCISVDSKCSSSKVTSTGKLKNSIVNYSIDSNKLKSNIVHQNRASIDNLKALNHKKVSNVKQAMKNLSSFNIKESFINEPSISDKVDSEEISPGDYISFLTKTEKFNCNYYGNKITNTDQVCGDCVPDEKNQVNKLMNVLFNPFVKDAAPVGEQKLLLEDAQCLKDSAQQDKLKEDSNILSDMGFSTLAANAADHPIMNGLIGGSWKGTNCLTQKRFHSDQNRSKVVASEMTAAVSKIVINCVTENGQTEIRISETKNYLDDGKMSPFTIESYFQVKGKATDVRKHRDVIGTVRSQLERIDEGTRISSGVSMLDNTDFPNPPPSAPPKPPSPLPPSKGPQKRTIPPNYGPPNLPSLTPSTNSPPLQTIDFPKYEFPYKPDQGVSHTETANDSFKQQCSANLNSINVKIDPLKSNQIAISDDQLSETNIKPNLNLEPENKLIKVPNRLPATIQNEPTFEESVDKMRKKFIVNTFESSKPVTKTLKPKKIYLKSIKANEYGNSDSKRKLRADPILDSQGYLIEPDNVNHPLELSEKLRDGKRMGRIGKKSVDSKKKLLAKDQSLKNDPRTDTTDDISKITELIEKYIVDNYEELSQYYLDVIHAPSLPNTDLKLHNSVKPVENVPAEKIKSFPLENPERIAAGYAKPKEGVLNIDLLSNPLLMTKFADIPSVSKILNDTLSNTSKKALDRWKEKMIGEMGLEKFQTFCNEQMRQGRDLHLAIKEQLIGRSAPEESDAKVQREIKRAVILNGGDADIEEDAGGNRLVIARCIDSIAPVLDEISDVMAVESFVVHPALGYKGVLDCVAKFKDKPVLIEWKLSSKPKSVIKSTYDAPIQLCAYLGALNYDKNYNFQVGGGMIVVAHLDGSPADKFEVTIDECNKFWIQWLKRLRKYSSLHSNVVV